VNASPDKIWPWLMQIGQDRSGFFSYTPLENLLGCEMPKVEALKPEGNLGTKAKPSGFAPPSTSKGRDTWWLPSSNRRKLL